MVIPSHAGNTCQLAKGLLRPQAVYPADRYEIPWPREDHSLCFYHPAGDFVELMTPTLGNICRLVIEIL